MSIFDNRGTAEHKDTPRTRSTGNGPILSTFEKFKNEVEIDSKTSIHLHSSEHMKDVSHPNYKKRIANGEIINSPCSYAKYSHESGMGTYYASNAGPDFYSGFGGSVTTYQDDYCFGLASTNYDELEEMEKGPIVAEAKFRCLRHLDTTPYAFAEDAGEIRETLRFIRRPFHQLLGIGKRHARREFGFKSKLVDPKKLHKEIASLWLETRFAASPLIRSAFQAVEAAQTRIPKPPPRLTARGFAEEADESSGTRQYNHSDTIFDEFSYHQTREISVRAFILYMVDNPLYDWKWKLGFRSKDIPYTAWQLLPFSFMVDRMLDISGAIQGLTGILDPRVKFLATGYTEHVDDLKKVKYLSQTNPGWSVNVSGDEVIRKDHAYNRVMWNPMVRDAIPTLHAKELVNDATKTLDLIALTISVFFGH